MHLTDDPMRDPSAHVVIPKGSSPKVPSLGKRQRWVRATDAEWEAYRIAARPLMIGPGEFLLLVGRNWLLQRGKLAFIAPIGEDPSQKRES